MMKFQKFRTKTTPVYEATKKFKVGKGKFTAEIKKKGSKFIASIDGQDLDTFKSEKEAEKAIKDFTKLMGK
jgi:glutathione peroxidase-family protein